MGSSILRGVKVADAGQGAIVDLAHDGQRIATFEIQPLPDFCGQCDSGVVPFWGVTAWRLYR
jgi:hypothetical protein